MKNSMIIFGISVVLGLSCVAYLLGYGNDNPNVTFIVGMVATLQGLTLSEQLRLKEYLLEKKYFKVK